MKTKAIWWIVTCFALILVAGLVFNGCTSKPTPTRIAMDGGWVLLVEIIDTDKYQGYMPGKFTAKVGEVIELRVTNEDYNERTTDQLVNAHGIILTGPGVSKSILELTPGQTKSITFTVKWGTYQFWCAQEECDIHEDLWGKIEVTE